MQRKENDLCSTFDLPRLHDKEHINIGKSRKLKIKTTKPKY
jgi:hypothetical protein